jgi:NhaP-type Na+/H+ or K+/H+ antiporter
MICVAPLPPLPAFALLLGTGAAAQWLAWRLRLPAILFLLGLGFCLGPLTGLLDPDRVFGDAFRPMVSLAVGLILFEGGMSLRLAELRGCGAVVRNLVSVGAMVTWGLTTLAARTIVGVPIPIAVLVGAILVLTGPTVVTPLIRHVRPRPPTGPILRWEGILIDPIGALLALLVLDAISTPDATVAMVLVELGRTIALGGGLGLFAGFGLGRALARYHVPEMLHVPITLGTVAVAFVAANLLQPEAGLLAVTVMGIVLGNRPGLDIDHVLEWKEQLSTVLLSVLFLSIAARLPFEQVTGLGWRAVAFTAALVLVVRPAAALVSTIGSSLRWADRAFLMAMAPRGIVVAAVSSEFALHLEQAGLPGSQELVALVFPVIVLSVVCYGLLARPVARALGIAHDDPQGVLLVGADPLARDIGIALAELGIDVLLVDTNAKNAAEARMLGLRTWHGSVLSSRFTDEAELAGIGNLVALTPSDEVNRLAVRQFASTFGRANSFLVAAPAGRNERPPTEAGRLLFAANTTLESLRERLRRGGRVKATRLTTQFGPADYTARYGTTALPLFVLGPDRKLQVVAADSAPALRAGCTIVSIVDGPDAQTTIAQ